MSEPDRVVVQASWISDAEFIGYFVAMAQGYYSGVGMTVDHRPGRSGLVPEMALLDGTATIALSSPESVAVTIARTGADLKIVAAQFQKSPLALISSAARPLRGIPDLVGKVIAVPPANRPLLEWLLKEAGYDAARTMLIDYDHDAGRLMTGEVDGFIDFAVDCTFRFAREGYPCHTVLLHDLDARLFNNVVVVTAPLLADQQNLLRRWLEATRQGWRENALDLARFPASLRAQYLTSERSLEAEIHANRAFSGLMGQPEKYFAMNDEAIGENIRTLAGLGHDAIGIFFPIS